MENLDVSVIVPTYREAENLAVLVPLIHSEFERRDLAGEVIVVDDNSPDDTVAVCNELAANFPVRLFVRKDERGLSSAVVHGMQQAIGRTLVVMDADLSHPPERIGDLVHCVDKRLADFVIGSRYAPGGSTDDQWGFFRWINSKVATLLARPLTSATDPMAGFFALRRADFLAADPLDPIGFKIGLELIVKCRSQRLAEVPIHFRDRLHGESKLSFREQIDYIRHLGRLYYHKLAARRRDDRSSSSTDNRQFRRAS